MPFVALSSSLRFYDFSLFQTVYAEEKDNVTQSNTLNDSGIIKGKKNNHSEAILDFDKAILLNPKNVNAYFNRANAKNILKDYQGALKDFNKVIELDPNYKKPYFRRARVYEELNEKEKALSDYTKYINLNPSDVSNAYNNRGNVKMSLGFEKGACIDYGLSIIYDGTKGKPYYQKKGLFIGKCIKTGRLNDTDKIDIVMEDGSEIPFSITELLIGNIKKEEFIEMGIAMYDLGIFKYAISIYDIAIDQGLNSSTIFSNRGNAKRKINDLSGAIKDHSKAIEINPEFYGFYMNRGNSKAMQKDFEGAINDYDQAIKLNPEIGKLFFLRGNAKLDLTNNLEKTCIDWKKASYLDKKYLPDFKKNCLGNNNLNSFDGKVIKDFQKEESKCWSNYLIIDGKKTCL